MNTEHLPPGPWRYMPNRHDDWGMVRDGNGLPIADTCPTGLAAKFSLQHTEFDEVRRRGPPQARAVAELLINAQSLIGWIPGPARAVNDASGYRKILKRKRKARHEDGQVRNG